MISLPSNSLTGISCPSEKDKRAAGQRQLPKENVRGRRHWLPLAPGMSCAFDRPGRRTISSTAARWAPVLGIQESHPLDGRRHGIIFGHRSGLPSRRSAGNPAAGSYHPGVAASLSCTAPGVFRREQSFIFDKLKGAVARETARAVLSQSNLAFYARHFCGISISISDA